MSTVSHIQSTIIKELEKMKYFAYTNFATLIVLAVSAFGSPVDINSNSTESLLEKRATYTGRGTYFDVGLGACGYKNVNSDPIVAISSKIYGKGANCNQWIKITDTKNHKIAYGLTRDECPGCGAGDLDLSPSLFEKFAPLSTGVIPISWSFQPKGFTPPK